MVQSEEQAGIQDVPRSQITNRILRATGALMLIQVILRGFGLIENIILGKYFGTSILADAYNAAREIAFYPIQFIDQAIMHSFLPVFVERMRAHGEREAWRLASTVINLLALSMLTLLLAGIVFTPDILPLFVPAWFQGRPEQSPQLIPLTVTLTRMMLAAVIFLASSSLTYSLLNSYKQFALPASADLALKGTVLVFAVVFAHAWGPVALAIGFVCGAVAKFVVHSVGLGRRFANYRPVLEVRHPSFRQFAWLALPLLIGVLFSIFRQVMDTRFTSSLPEGSLSALKYARKLCDVPVAFFPYVFGIALFPFLADIVLSGDKERLRGMLMTATRMMMLIFVPLAVTLILMRYPIVNGLFGSEQFDKDSADLTAAPLVIYALGMLAAALEIVVLQFFFAMKDTVRPIIVGIAMLPLHIGIAYLGVYHWGLQATAIALALLVNKSSKVLILYVLMRRKIFTLEGRRTLLLAGKMLLALAPFIAIIWLGVHYLPEPAQVSGKINKIIALLPYGVVAGVATLIYLAILHALRAEEVSIMVDKLRRKLRKSSAPTPAG
ncbi:MAG: murein biosynthesis integral membrane protein MurJ [Armatimonadota bacterium]